VTTSRRSTLAARASVAGVSRLHPKRQLPDFHSDQQESYDDQG
jgi:hypothetical protein